MADSGKPKNLLIIISDEHRKDAMGCAGHAIVRTPNIDALAARGSMFTNAYTPSPMCVPTRAAIACGDHVHRIGYWDSATPYDGRRRTWMHHLRDAGREVVSIGKLHFRSGADDNGFSEEILPMHVVGGVGWAIGLLRQDPPPYTSAAELADDVGAGPSSYTDYDRAITDAAEHWLASRARGAEPWAAFVSLVSPHYPLRAPREFFDLYDPATVDLPIGFGERRPPSHPELRNIASFYDYDRYFDEQRMREARVAYYGLVSFMDHCVGRILTALDSSGARDDTMVLYTSDHGEMLGDQGYWTKQLMYEASAGVPLIVAGPGIPAGRKVATAASLLDLAPTAVSVTGSPDDDWSRALPGRSLAALACEPDDLERTAFSEYHDGGSKTGTFMVRWQSWKYIAYVGQPPQLFDLSADPHELEDLAPESRWRPEVAAALTEGARRLTAVCDPEEVNARCFADQGARIAALGGRQACESAYLFNHTPTPDEQERMKTGPAL
ncbi:MAG: sulfatase-like hydrolase/transferase [Rhizobiales bacterium]|nr:sulfatase-like hydrolase/transferase [Hyphomicrobiales bacterium]